MDKDLIMTPMIWLIILIICLVIEFIRIELIGACGAVGAIAGLVVCLFGLGGVWQVLIAVAVAVLLIVTVRPIGMKYVMRARREKQIMELEGCDAIVTCRIDNATRSGVVRIGAFPPSTITGGISTSASEPLYLAMLALPSSSLYSKSLWGV